MEFLIAFWLLAFIAAVASWWLLRSRSIGALVMTIALSILTAAYFAFLAFMVWQLHGAPVSNGFEQHDWPLLGVELLLPFWVSAGMSVTAIGAFLSRSRK